MNVVVFSRITDFRRYRFGYGIGYINQFMGKVLFTYILHEPSIGPERIVAFRQVFTQWNMSVKTPQRVRSYFHSLHQVAQRIHQLYIYISAGISLL